MSMQRVFLCHETSSHGTSRNTKGPIYVFQQHGSGMHDKFAVSTKLNYNEASRLVLDTKMLISHYSKCIRHTSSKQTFRVSGNIFGYKKKDQKIWLTKIAVK